MAPSPPPARRFKPEPLETTIRHSKASSPGIAAEDTPGSNTGGMAPQTKPRRVLPQPIEESHRSSRGAHAEHVEAPGEGEESSPPEKSTHYSYGDDPTLPGVVNSRPPRRFAPEPIETTEKTSRRNPPLEPVAPEAATDNVQDEAGSAESASKPRRRFAPEPVLTSARSSKDKKDNGEPKPRRRFAPEPVETSTRSSKDKQVEEEQPKPRRRFAPEPMEMSTRSSKDKQQAEKDHSPSSRPRRKFAPQLVETETRRRRSQHTPSDHLDVEQLASDDSSRASSGPRKFSPELIETAKGSYRRVHLPQRGPPEPEASPKLVLPEETNDQVPELEESRFSAAALARRHPEITRKHSFIVPDLPMIESSEDEASTAPSLTDSKSSADTESKALEPHAEESYTDYVLRLADEPCDPKDLQEAAMAAYINERPHEPVDHFAISHDDDEDGPLPVPMFQGERGVDVRTFRRSSAAELDLEMERMRKHHEQLERAKAELKADTAGQSRFSAVALATRHKLEEQRTLKTKRQKAEDEELARMRAAASPPMLGDDIVFPYTISPKMTRCDPDQVPRPRNAESGDDDEIQTPTALWGQQSKAQDNSGGGLWMGLCQVGESQPSSPLGLRSGIQTPAPQTPAAERTNPFDLGTTTPGRGTKTPKRRVFANLPFLPLTPPRSADGDDMFTSTIDKKLMLEKQIEEEFPPRVITQIYNYLSLGYPNLAHAFDEELSKISRISLEELRRDDGNVNAKGYVGAPEGDGADEREVTGGKCKRWEALRLYVREWARQSPNFADERAKEGKRPAEGVGMGGRKGSWGH